LLVGGCILVFGCLFIWGFDFFGMVWVVVIYDVFLL